MLTKFFIEALQKAGYTTVLDTSPTELAAQVKYDAIIEGEIVEFWADVTGRNSPCWHKVVVRVQATDPVNQRVLWDKVIEGQASQVFSDWYTEFIERAVTVALDNATWEFASDDFYAKVIAKVP